MILKQGSKKIKTSLKKGDKGVWFKRHGTVGFLRGAERLHRTDGDDKFLLKPHNLLQVQECMQMVAEASGLTVELDHDADHLAFFCFG